MRPSLALRAVLPGLILCNLVLAVLGIFLTRSPRAPSASQPSQPSQSSQPPQPWQSSQPARGEALADRGGRLRAVSRYSTQVLSEYMTAAARAPWIFLGGVGGITVLKLDEDGVPTLATRQDAGVPYRMLLQGNVLLTADRRGGLVAHDVSQPQTPRRLWAYHAGAPVYGMAARDGTLALAAAGEGLLLMDWPRADQAPQLKARHTADGDARDVAWKDDGSLVLGLAKGGLRMLRVDASGNPAVVGRLPLKGIVSRIQTRGSRVYVALGAFGLASVDVSDPDTPRLLSLLPSRHAVVDLAVHKDHVLAAEWEGIRMVRDGKSGLVASATASLADGPDTHAMITAAGFVGSRPFAVTWHGFHLLALDQARPDKSGAADERPPPAPGIMAPDFELPVIDASSVSLRQFRGRPVMLFFFSDG